MTSPNGNPVPNQFIIEDEKFNESGNIVQCFYFQSYKSIIVLEENDETGTRIYLDQTYWNYSKITSKYRNVFLNETTAETERKIATGEYILTDLN